MLVELVPSPWWVTWRYWQGPKPAVRLAMAFSSGHGGGFMAVAMVMVVRVGLLKKAHLYVETLCRMVQRLT